MRPSPAALLVVSAAGDVHSITVAWDRVLLLSIDRGMAGGAHLGSGHSVGFSWRAVDKLEEGECKPRRDMHFCLAQSEGSL